MRSLNVINEEILSPNTPDDVSKNPARVDDIKTENTEKSSICRGNLTRSQHLVLHGAAKDLEVMTSIMVHESVTNTDKSASTSKKSATSMPISTRKFLAPKSNFRKGSMKSTTSVKESMNSPTNSTIQTRKSPISEEDQMLLDLGLSVTDIGAAEI